MGECCYRNDSSKMIILKCIGENQFFCEKVLMPLEVYFFEAPDDARLELWLLNGGEPMLHTTAEAREYALLSHRKDDDP
ncbi:hypothetical protein WB44_06085 [Synechococcus sp. WH 8020]|uniref:DUF1830 domain-containing protein n=1 Tax=Synechococcus sp. (strain WH8020) TaxID=32052 RepID=UPI00065269D7|nr:DUF1830 domain-containing protein [Synechococcus sp. WH 8020]AKN60736.1 hypothetical protein WB44_06085 [Synechococcus sp. WH 8020]